MCIITLYVCLTRHKVNIGQGISLFFFWLHPFLSRVVGLLFLVVLFDCLFLWVLFELVFCFVLVWYGFFVVVCFHFFWGGWGGGGHLQYQRAPQITQCVSLRIRKRFGAQRLTDALRAHKKNCFYQLSEPL